MYLADLADQEVSLICRTLQLCPGDDGLQFSNRTLSLLKQFPLDLQRPHGLLRLVSPRQDDYTPLCALHKPISAPLVHAIFQFVALEAGLRLNKLVSNGKFLSNDQTETIQAVRRIHSLWLPAETYRLTFLEEPDYQHRPYQEDCCQACILSRIGGDLSILLAFRQILLSKTHRDLNVRSGRPSLLRWVQAWIASLSTKVGLDSVVFESTISANDADSELLKSVRRAISHAGRSSRRARSSFNAAPNYESLQIAPPESDEGPTDYDAEISVIDHYAALMSTPHLPQNLFSSFDRSRPSTAYAPNGVRTVIGKAALSPHEPIDGQTQVHNKNRYVSPTVTEPRPTSSIYSRDTDAVSFLQASGAGGPGFHENADSDRQSTALSNETFQPNRDSSWTNASISQANYTDGNPVDHDRSRRSTIGISILHPNPADAGHDNNPQQSARSSVSRYSTAAPSSYRNTLCTQIPPGNHIAPNPDDIRAVGSSYVRPRPSTAHAGETNLSPLVCDYLTPTRQSTVRPSRPSSSYTGSSTLVPSSLSHATRESVMHNSHHNTININNDGVSGDNPANNLNRSSSTRAIHAMRHSMQRDQSRQQERRHGDHGRRSDASRETTWSRIVRAANGES